MDEKLQQANEIKRLTAPLLARGFTFEYFYEKGGDSSCAYICRYKKGKDYFDWREVSGSKEIGFITYIGGVYDFPSLKKKYSKEYREFAFKHLLKKPTMEEIRIFTAELLCKDLTDESKDFFGIKL